MTEKVTVIRYIRKDPDIWIDSNLGGATIAFELDYDRRMVKAAAAVCSEEDNFEKKRGIETATKRLQDDANCVEFPLDYVDHYSGLVNSFVFFIMEKYIHAEQQGELANIPETIARAVTLDRYYIECEEIAISCN